MVETHTITIIRTRNASTVYCEICQEKVQIFSPPEIISGFCLKSAEIRQLFLAGEMHFVGLTKMLCGNSIAAYFRNK
jgi:hypothetical protein